MCMCIYICVCVYFFFNENEKLDDKIYCVFMYRCVACNFYEPRHISYYGVKFNAKSFCICNFFFFFLGEEVKWQGLLIAFMAQLTFNSN